MIKNEIRFRLHGVAEDQKRDSFLASWSGLGLELIFVFSFVERQGIRIKICLRIHRVLAKGNKDLWRL